jgi:hypothetical protein
MFSQPAACRPVICPAVDRSARRFPSNLRHQNQAPWQIAWGQICLLKNWHWRQGFIECHKGSEKNFQAGKKPLALLAARVQFGLVNC